ncbi:MAG: hypothetical protein AAB414_04090 [Patescibacteria group bacterium]
MTQVETDRNQPVYSFGDDLINPFAAKLIALAEDGQNSKAAELLEVASQADAIDRQVVIVRLGKELESLGTLWQDLTFNRRYKKAEAIPSMQTQWSLVSSELVSLDPEARLAILNSFPKGLRVAEDRATRTQERYVIASGGFEAQHRDDSVVHFLDGVAPHKINFSVPSFITLAAILELSGYPNSPALDSLQGYLKKDEVHFLLAEQEEVRLPMFLMILNDWISSTVDIQSR